MTTATDHKVFSLYPFILGDLPFITPELEKVRVMLYVWETKAAFQCATGSAGSAATEWEEKNPSFYRIHLVRQDTCFTASHLAHEAFHVALNLHFSLLGGDAISADEVDLAAPSHRLIYLAHYIITAAQSRLLDHGIQLHEFSYPYNRMRQQARRVAAREARDNR